MVAPASAYVYFPDMTGLWKKDNNNKITTTTTNQTTKNPTTDKYQEDEELLHIKSYLGHWCEGGTSSSPYKNLLGFF